MTCRVKSGVTSSLSLSKVLSADYAKAVKIEYNHKNVFDFKLKETADAKVLIKQLKPALEKKQKKMLEVDVTNIDRTFGTVFTTIPEASCPPAIGYP